MPSHDDDILTTGLDLEILARDIQAINSADAVAAFFARLGYNTNARLKTSPATLGITAEGTTRPIRNVELLADHEGLLQIYLFELTSVTVTHTRHLARAFRNRVGEQLIVLTSDYETLDFVLLERYLPTDEASATPMTQKQVSRRPRVLTVNRRNPTPVQIRVLRRFTWTELDVFAQYDKLLSAYSVADWSEEYFNNHALFSDYYLKERLPEEPQWREQSKPVYLTLKELYRGAASKFAQTGFPELRERLFEPVFGHLGFSLESPAKSRAPEPVPHLILKAKAGGPTLAACLAYRWNRNLDGKDEKDLARADENPTAAVVSLLEQGESRWAIVTNGKLWRLYSAEAHSRATNYYEIDLQEILAETGAAAANPGDSFPFFWLLFRHAAFEETETDWDGTRIKLSSLDLLLRQSQKYAKDLGESLKRRVFEEVFPHLAQGFITCIRNQEGAEAEFDPARLASIFQGTLTLLYRLLFLLFAESRNLLPVREVRGYFDASLARLKDEIADRAGLIEDLDLRLTKLRPIYREDSFGLYDRLSRLFKVIDEGDPALNVPVYNGGLFLSNPQEEDRTPEAVNGRFLIKNRIPDLHLAMAMDLLSRDIDPKRNSLAMIDYKTLGVRHLGSIYEGLLEFTIRIAARRMGIAKEDGKEVYKAFTELDERQQARAKRENRVVKKGRVYLENDKHERKASGSYYTPDHIVKYIVANTVGPVLKEKFETLRPKLREAQAARRAFFKRQEALKKQGLRPEPEAKAELSGDSFVDEFFDSKVLDPAMGSGHFLVEAVDFITDKTLTFLSSFPTNPVFAYLGNMRKTILKEMEEKQITIDEKKLTDVNLLKRHVLKRCIYGVDLNPMAVELAKVSLWLDCFTLGAPLSFLDHHLRCGNSLVGVTVHEVEKALTQQESGTQFGLFESRFPGLLAAVEAMRHVGELSDITDSQIGKSRAQYRKAEGLLAPLQRWLDVYTSQWFGNGVEGKRRRGAPEPEPVALPFLRHQLAHEFLMADGEHRLRRALTDLPSELRAIADRSLAVAEEKRFFHWELEFPEVFYGPRPGTERTIERLEGAGFDVVIGNPPYEVLSEKESGEDLAEEGEFFGAAEVYGPAVHGKKNFFKLFICRGVACARSGGAFSFIVPMSLLGDEQSAGARGLLLSRTISTIEVFPQKDDPHKRVFPEAKLAICVFVTRNVHSHSPFIVRTHAAGVFAEDANTLTVAAQDLFAFDEVNAVIPSCTQRDWKLALQVSRHGRRVGDYCEAFQGEVNETTDGKRGFVSSRASDGQQILRGSSICLYVIREQSQGEVIYLKTKKFLAGKPDSKKANHHRYARIGWQESSAQNNFRRIIAARIPKGNFCNHKINYIPECDSKLSLSFLLALLNSKLSDWFFRLSSTNAAVSHYQIYRLPAPFIEARPSGTGRTVGTAHMAAIKKYLGAVQDRPGTMPEEVVDAIANLSDEAHKIESARILMNRSERSQLAVESQELQDLIDAALFRCFGLTDDDASYISGRLKEML